MKKVKRVVLGEGYAKLDVLQVGGTYCFIGIFDKDGNPISGFRKNSLPIFKKIRLIAEVIE